MGARVKGVVVHEIELATYLVSKKIGGFVQIEFSGPEQTPVYIFSDVTRANELIAAFRTNGLDVLLTKYYSAVKELDLAVELAAVAKGIQ